MDLNVNKIALVTQDEFNEWYALQNQMREIKEREMELRRKIFAFYFQDAVEGTNKLEMQDGYVLNAKRVINRSVDKGSLVSLTPELQAAGIKVDDLVEWKPSLKISAYRKLTEAQTQLFDQVLVVKDGSPSLEIVAPKGDK